MPKCIVGMLNAELPQARRWCQKLTLSSRLFFSNTVCTEMSLATFSVIVKDPGKKICEPKIYSYPSQIVNGGSHACCCCAAGFLFSE